MKPLLILALTLFLTGCDEGKRTNFTTIKDGKMVMTEESTVIMDDLIDEFNTCRNESVQNLQDCKYFIAKAICDFYQIEDFVKDGKYIDYQKMHDIIKGKFGTWKPLGPAMEQKALEAAQDAANNGQATVAISHSSPYGHVVIVLPGELQKAPSWNGLEVPQCASFFMIKRLEPFHSKGLAYAWRSPEDIMLYSKTPE